MNTAAATKGFNPNEKKLFNQMLELYDNKSHDKAMKNCEIILENRPEHPGK